MKNMVNRSRRLIDKFTSNIGHVVLKVSIDSIRIELKLDGPIGLLDQIIKVCLPSRF